MKASLFALCAVVLLTNAACSAKSESNAKISGSEPTIIAPVDPIIDPPLGSPTLGTGSVILGPTGYTCNGSDKCYDLTIHCEDIATDAKVTLYAAEPTAAYKGTITFHSGSGGKGFYASEPNSQGILSYARSLGYRTVQVKWKDAWLQGTEGLQKLSCRPATAIQWARDNLSDFSGDGAFCSTGNSGGSVQVMTSLIWYGIGMDLALPTSGPGMGDIKTGCLDTSSPLYLHDQQTIFDSTYGASACSDANASYTSRFEADSLALGSFGYNFPSTMVYMLLGANDGLATIPQSDLVYDRLVADAQPLLNKEVLAGVGHSLQQDPAGAAKIKSVLAASCIKQGAPPPPVEPVFDVLCPGPEGAGPYFNLNNKTKIHKMTTVVLVGHDHVKAKFYGSDNSLKAVIYDITHKCTNLNLILPPDDYHAEFFDMDTGMSPIPVSLADSTFKVH